MKTQEKQKKIFVILKAFSTKRLDKITEDNFSFSKLTKQEAFLFMECVWLDLGKKQATDTELRVGIRNVYTLFILEDLRRHKLVKLNEKGFIERTKLGNEVKKSLEKKKNEKTI